MTSTPQSLPPSVNIPAAASPGEGATVPRSWRIEFPPRQKLLNANQRMHHQPRNRIVQQLRGDAFKLAKFHKVPQLKRARIVCFYDPPTRGRPAAKDVHNLYPTGKALVDGLVDAGVLEDDCDEFLEGPDMRPGTPFPGGRVVLLITELPEGRPR
jgi:crossover junction endodeoxyribonuclease RusA